MQSLAELTCELCAVPSPIGEERALCDMLEQRLSRQTLAAPIRRHQNSLVVPVSRGRRGYHIALVGHLDTVRTENGPSRIEGDRVYGSGASDMKSGLAVMVALLERGVLAASPHNITLVLYSREEGPFAENELGLVLAEEPELREVSLAICLEPSDNRLHLGCVGSIHATLTVSGRTAHSARPWEGESAVSKAAILLTELSELAPVSHRVEGLTYRSVTTVTQIRDGGRGRNVVPDVCVLNVNHRFAPTTSMADAEGYVVSLLEPHGAVEITDLSPSARPSRSHPLVQNLIDCGVRAVEPKQAWTDVARFAELSVPAVNFGPGENAQAHQKDESTSISLLEEGYGIFEKFLRVR